MYLKWKHSGRNKERAVKTQSEYFRRRKENQIIVQVSLIVGSFLLGYLPRTGSKRN